MRAAAADTWPAATGRQRTVVGPDARCGCAHTRAAHEGRLEASRDVLGRPLEAAADVRFPDACSIQLCGCEVFRGEADR